MQSRAEGYRCPEHGHFKSRSGWDFHVGWCETGWQVAEVEIVRREERSAVVRPVWAVGRSTAEVRDLARHEGLNPYDVEWADSIDSKVKAEFTAGRLYVRPA